ncbi:hypothetical protein ACFLZ6_01930 [Nanoarchaeota archaeon]
MARNFRAEEDELDIWFDDEKERITEESIKKIDALTKRDEDEEGDKVKKKPKQKIDADKARKQIEKELLSSMQKLRKNYQKKYIKIKSDEENLKSRKKKAKIVFNPFKVSFSFLLRIFKSSFSSIKKHAVKVFIAVKKRITHFFDHISYSTSKYYIFHMRRKMSPILWPIANIHRIHIVRPIRKITEKSKALYKQTIKFTSDFFSKSLELIVKYAKLALDFIVKYAKLTSGSITGVSKKTSAFFNKYIKPVIPVPKKDE